MSGPTPDFWQQRFESGQTAWDRGEAHPQLHAWLAQGLIRPGQTVLVPGCGRGHELLALGRAGVTALGLDYTPAAVAQAQARLHAAGPLAASAQVQQADVLVWQPQGASEQPDVVYEQTCLCALHPDHWTSYAAQLHRWLPQGGHLLALFMQARRESAQQGTVEGPPYHGDINAMRALFPSPLWEWSAPPYAAVPHPQGWFELAVALRKR